VLPRLTDCFCDHDKLTKLKLKHHPKMQRRYDEDIDIAYACEVYEDGATRRIFTMVRRPDNVVLVPFGDLTASTLELRTWDLTTNADIFQTYNNQGELVDIEPLGEFHAKLPKRNLDCVPTLQLAGAFLVASVLFMDEDGVSDEKETVVLVKDLLRGYPETASAISKQLSEALGNSFLYTFEIGEIEANAKVLANNHKLCYSPNNYYLSKKYRTENFDDPYLFTPISSIVGPYRPSKMHKGFHMYAADFLSFYSNKDKPDIAQPLGALVAAAAAASPVPMDVAEPVVPIEPAAPPEVPKVPMVPEVSQDEDGTLPSLQSRKDFRQQVLHRVQEMPDLEQFTSEGHLDAILKYSNMTKSALEKQCNDDFEKYHENNFCKFRLLMSCEAMSVFYGKVMKYDFTKKRRRDEADV